MSSPTNLPRECPLCHRKFVLIPTDPPDRRICAFCHLGIKINGASKMEPIPHGRPR